jgi:hypothetical protein
LAPQLALDDAPARRVRDEDLDRRPAPANNKAPDSQQLIANLAGDTRQAAGFASAIPPQRFWWIAHEPSCEMCGTADVLRAGGTNVEEGDALVVLEACRPPGVWLLGGHKEAQELRN